MEGFGFFPGTASFRLPESPWPEAYSQYMAGSSSSNSVGRTHIDETLESAFARLNVTSFSRQPRLPSFDGGDYGLFGGENLVPFRDCELQRTNGSFPHLALDDCWVDPDLVGYRHSDTGSDWSSVSIDRLSVAQLRGKVVSLAKDEHGCRFLQKVTEVAPRKELIDLIFSEVVDHLASLIPDHHGSYVVQKLVEVCSEDQRTHMLLKLTKNNEFQLLCIALNTRGTRTIQKLLKYVTTKQQVGLIMRALNPRAVELSKNLNGQHVIDHCLQNLSYEDNKGLLLVVANNCTTIAKDKCGCCVLQKCVEYSKGETRAMLVEAITENSIVLAGDRYGNYVLQHLLGLKIRWITAKLLLQLQGSYISLCCNKYGSNVVEKCLSESGEDQSSQIIFELLTNPNVSMLLLHQYGNYVIQTALAVSKGIYHEALLNLVERNYYMMFHNQFGQRILRSLNRI